MAAFFGAFQKSRECPGLDVFVEPLNVQPVGFTPRPAAKKAPVPAAKSDNEKDGAEKNALREAYRELVTESANRVIATEIRNLRAIAAKHRQTVKREREITKFYDGFPKPAPTT